MSTLFKANIDQTFSLHFQRDELEALIVMLTLVDPTNPNGGMHAPALVNMLNQIKAEIGKKQFDKIDSTVWVTYEADSDSDDWFVQFIDE